MALVGCENTVATELKHLEANRFELSQLRGKVLMVITDAERYSGPGQCAQSHYRPGLCPHGGKIQSAAHRGGARHGGRGGQ